MGNIYSERKALEEYIQWIKEERRRLSEEYWRAINRLRDLDNKVEQNTNIELADNLISVLDKQNQIVEKLGNLIPKVPIETTLEYIKQTHSNIETIEVEKVSQEIVQQIEQQKDADEVSKPVKRRKRNDMKALAYEVSSYLKDRGLPTKAKDINEYLEQKGYKIKYITSAMNQMMNYNNRIERIGKGYYQYRV